MNDLITIIINVYNGEKYIEKCLDCIINQTYKNLEILIINDESTDNTLNIIKKYKDKRIKTITTENKGLALSRNVGIDNAKGKYIYFIDVDDLIEKDTIEYLYNLIKKYNCDIATSKYLNVYDYNIKVKHPPEIIEEFDKKEMLKRIFLRQGNTVCIWNKLINKDLFNDLRFEDILVDDLDFTHKLIIKTDRIIYSNQVKYFHLINIDSVCSRKFEDYNWTIESYKAVLNRYNYINELFPNFIENDYCILEFITKFYLRQNKKIINYLNESGTIKLYNKVFSLKILKSNINYKQKLKLLLFRISPKLNTLVFRTYLRIKRMQEIKK